MAVKLSASSYLVLGLVSMLEPATSYDIKRAAARTIGNFWTFAHTQLYNEPQRLAAAGLLEQQREPHGRRRRLFRITPAGRDALASWLGSTADVGLTEIRDLGLLKLFFAGLAPDDTAAHRLALAKAAAHGEKLRSYEQVRERLRTPGAPERVFPGDADPRMARFRARTLELGIAYEQLAADFWRGVAADTGAG